MWKDYSIGFIKKNRASSVSVLVAAFISALFLSLLCGLFYNFWNYEIESVVLEEGNWQGRISGAFEEDKVSEIENFANVKTAIINEDLSDDQTLVVDICFDNMRSVYQDMSLGEIAQNMQISRQGVFDLVRRCDKILVSYEERLHLIEKFSKVKDTVQRIEVISTQKEIKDLANQILEEL